MHACIHPFWMKVKAKNGVYPCSLFARSLGSLQLAPSSSSSSPSPSRAPIPENIIPGRVPFGRLHYLPSGSVYCPFLSSFFFFLFFLLFLFVCSLAFFVVELDPTLFLSRTLWHFFLFL